MRTKRSNGVAPKKPPRTEQRRRARAWRIENLVRVINLAYGDHDPDAIYEEARRLHQRMARPWTSTIGPPGNPAEAIIEMRSALREGLETITRAGDYDDVWTLPEVGRYVTKSRDGYLGIHDGRFDKVFLHECADLVTGPEGHRLKRCSEEGCGRLFVQQKRGVYCEQHGSSGARSERYRQRLELTPEEKRERRRRYYLASLKKHDPARWRHKVKSNGGIVDGK
jgi:predicted RNA-binding Zn ribbon-like protein